MAVFSCEDYLQKCMMECWAESPDMRPDFKSLHTRKLKPLRDTMYVCNVYTAVKTHCVHKSKHFLPQRTS